MSMRLIDADALLESGICAEYGYNDNGLLLIPMRDVTNSIRNAPTIDAEPVRHGLWETREYTTEDDWDDWGVINHREEVCSECGKWQSERSKFCSHCGAKMDGEAD